MTHRLGAWLLAAAALLLLAAPASAANFTILNGDYDQHFRPGETMIFSALVRNNEATTQFIEVDVVLVNTQTLQETSLTPVLLAFNVSPGETRHTHASIVAPQPGTYSVIFIVFDGNGIESDRLRGRFPLHIGSETESLRVFPEAINLGTIPPGRYMYPTPIEVRWDFYQFNNLRQDQKFTVRMYTDNAARYEGIPHAVRKPSSAGLVSMDGRYVIPLKCWTLNFGPDIQSTGWDSTLAGPPPVDEDDIWLGPPLLEGGRNFGSASWVRVPDLTDMTPDPITWRRLIGQDITDSRFVSDVNPTGDFTLSSPFTVYFATDAGPTAVEGSYAANLVVELWNP